MSAKIAWREEGGARYQVPALHPPAVHNLDGERRFTGRTATAGLGVWGHGQGCIMWFSGCQRGGEGWWLQEREAEDKEGFLLPGGGGAEGSQEQEAMVRPGKLHHLS